MITKNSRVGFLFLATLLILFVANAFAVITVDIESYEPSNGQLDNENTNELTINWDIEVDEGESGNYQVEVGGDGTPDSGEVVEDGDGEGSFSGNKSGSTKITVKDDLNDGDGDYTIYFIATNSADTEDYVHDSITVNLDNVPGAPGGFSVGVGDEKLFLEWSKGDDRDIDRFLIYYDTESREDLEDYNGKGAKEGDSPIDAGEASGITVKGLENGTTYYFRLVVEDEAGNVSEPTKEKSGTPSKVSGLAELANEEGGCFVATAAFGDYDAKEVLVLRRLRDDILSENAIGRALIKLYYQTSPPLASFIAGSDRLRLVARTALWPAVAGSAAFLALPTWSRPLALVLPLILLIIAWRYRRRMQKSSLNGVVVLALVGLILLAAPNAALAGQSPIRFTTNLHVDFLFIDEQAFEKVYNQDWMFTFGFGFGVKLVKDLELLAGISYGFKDGEGITKGGSATDEAYRFHVVPGSLSLLYRLKFYENQPVVPYLGGGGSAAFYHEQRTEEPDINTTGGKYGYHGLGGVQFLLDWMDKRAAAHMDLDFGINNTYLYYQFKYQVLDNFGQTKEDEGLSLTNMTHTAGLMFEF